MTTNIWMKRLAAGAMLTAAPALFAIGAAGASNAATGSVDTGPHMSQPTHHAAFPGQDRNDGPGTRLITTTSGTTVGDRHLKTSGGEASKASPPRFRCADLTESDVALHVLPCGMEQIGIRELRQPRQQVGQQGARGRVGCEITDRGRPVAHLVPIRSADPDRDALAAAGLLAPAPAPRPTFDASALIAGVDLSAVLDEQRSDR